MSEQEKAVDIYREKFVRAQREALAKFETGEIVVGYGTISQEALIVGIDPNALPDEDIEMFANIEQGTTTLPEFIKWRNAAEKSIQDESIAKGLYKKEEWELGGPLPSPEIVREDYLFRTRHPRERLVYFLTWRGADTGVLKK